MINPHVLVVDDEADIRVLIKDILSDEGYGVTAAANATEARDARAGRLSSARCGPLDAAHRIFKEASHSSSCWSPSSKPAA